jgi:hypothetical protein
MDKFAVVIGVNYPGSNMELNGCCFDAERLRTMLIEKFHYKPENIRLLIDEKSDNLDAPVIEPTKKNIMESMAWLTEQGGNSAPGSQLWFSYSGHGYYQTDREGEESDGKDECIVPVDCNTEGMIIDDVFRQQLVNKVPDHCKCSVMMDCCHSGTILDLSYSYTFTNKINRKRVYKRDDDKNNVLCISGCLDKQVSMEYFDAEYQKSVGALTHYFLENMEKADYHVSCFNVLKGISNKLKANGFKQQVVMSYNGKLYGRNWYAINPDKLSCFMQA